VTKVEEPKYLPGSGYDPVNNAADRAKLEYYWLPARSDPTTQPALYAHWAMMFLPSPTFVRAKSVSMGPRASFLQYLDAPSLGGRRLESSRNWAGAYLSSRGGNRLKRVVGVWTVPEVKPGVRQESDAGKEFQCSAWIGIDGKKGWTNSMPQVGTEHKIELNGTFTHTVWWEWWLRDENPPEWPWAITGIAIQPGHKMLCSISVMSGNCVRIHVLNRTTGYFATVQLTGKMPLVGATAQWIVERQSNVFLRPDFQYPMPDYGEVKFENCAIENHAATLPEPPWVPRYIRLTEAFKNQGRVAVISMPSLREKSRTLRVTYQRPDVPSV